MTAPKVPLADIPIIYGSAIGFLKSVWVIAPLLPNNIPIIIAINALGILKFQIILYSIKSLFSFPKSKFNPLIKSIS